MKNDVDFFNVFFAVYNSIKTDITEYFGVFHPPTVHPQG